ncbi:UDP-glucose 4-epimerase GalE [Solemya elarraichensis gill symbiont]|uniref:UDP-glucose 4-epimerase n=1 Tax=Solemya elarraichensis gill symbiont TaxID=1918949 RepID=A0A1T2LBI8_9GAMM|nr:UDP-glucose 4-epimerase GalE [Solemya elarraichensis gill symbiont]OOZ42467.1 UDP-glucose 4-epimerase GalE [Solemya elarraichensis gill symbiont]
MKVLVTGGAGYIGTHTLLELLGCGHDVLVVDNYSNSSPIALQRVRKLAGRDFESLQIDIRDTEQLTEAMLEFQPQAVIHFAGLKAVGESVEQPLRYYSNNVDGSISLLLAMDKAAGHNFIFSSSATVYGAPQYLPYDEKHPVKAVNPYGSSKLMVEEILGDWCKSAPGTAAISLRYFNPVGAHTSGEIGEDPQGIPNNLMPCIAQTAVGRLPQLKVFGSDYDKRDGTGERDYIHVMDLARAHVAALDYLEQCNSFDAINIGTGKGLTVLELVKTFEQSSQQVIPLELVERRAGDLVSVYADASKASRLLNWSAELDVDAMCRDTWRWQSQNPQGYSGE